MPCEACPAFDGARGTHEGMQVTAWNNGQWNASGAGYGIRLTRRDRDREFRREWDEVYLVLDEVVALKLSKSFWRRCAELRSQKIGTWLRSRGLATWQKGCPPQLKLKSVGDRTFQLSLTDD